MTVQPDLPHKVSQIRHDLDDLYELMSQVERNQVHTAGILQRHGNRLEELQQTLDLHGGRLDRIEGRLGRVDGRLGRVDGRLDRIEDNQHQMADNQSRQFEHLSAQMAEILNVLRAPAVADPAPESER